MKRLVNDFLLDILDISLEAAGSYDFVGDGDLPRDRRRSHPRLREAVTRILRQEFGFDGLVLNQSANGVYMDSSFLHASTA